MRAKIALRDDTQHRLHKLRAPFAQQENMVIRLANHQRELRAQIALRDDIQHRLHKLRAPAKVHRANLGIDTLDIGPVEARGTP